MDRRRDEAGPETQMDITPSPEFCAAYRIVLTCDMPDIVIPALRTELSREIERGPQRHCRGAAGRGPAA